MASWDIDSNYTRVCTTPGDIHEHLPVLYGYASKVTSVGEMGLRSIVSTWAFLRGLRDNQAATKHLLTVDIENIPEIPDIAAHVAREGIQLEFMQGDSAQVSLPPVDLLFIDTWHVYGHLKRELAAHQQQVRRWIILHDTEVDKVAGESLRMGMDIDAQVKQYGYPREEITCGLQKALDEFLEAHGDTWRVAAHYTNNNGLTVLERKQSPP